MPAVSNVLVAGAGLAGTATATHLAAAGVAVDLIDVKRDRHRARLRHHLAGQRAARAAPRSASGSRSARRATASAASGFRAPDPAGTLLAEVPDARSGGSDLPATAGMPRPALARILVDRAAQAGARIRLGTSYTALRQDAAGVEVTFADGSAGRYDLVVAADGIRSPTRRMLGIDAGAAPERDGHLAGVRPPARQRHPHRPDLRRPLLHRRVLPDRRRTRCTPTSSRTRRTAAR